MSDEFVIYPTEDQCFRDGLSGFAWIIIDVHGTIVRASEKAEKLFGYDSRKFFEGKKIELLLPADFCESHVRLREDYMLSGGIRSMDKGRGVRGVKQDGTEIFVTVALASWHCNRHMYVTAMVTECE